MDPSDPSVREEAVDHLCQLCGMSVGAMVPVRKKGHWSYLQCGNCGVLSLNPIPDEETLRSYYNETYAVPHEAYARRVAEHAPPILRELRRRFPDSGKLLEVGCSYGFFLDAARQNGWMTAGIELDERAVVYGRQKLGLKILAGTLESEVERLEPPYDAIAAFHVIEHLPDPGEFLRRCRGLLREGGVLVLKTPNVESWIAKRTGVYWEWLSPPAHIHLFSSGPLQRALQNSGFHLGRIWSRRGDAHNHLFQLICAWRAYLASKRGSVLGKSESLGAKKRGARSDGWRVNALLKLSEAIYYPCALALDPWLEKKGLQPELVAIATAAVLS